MLNDIGGEPALDIVVQESIVREPGDDLDQGQADSVKVFEHVIL